MVEKQGEYPAICANLPTPIFCLDKQNRLLNLNHDAAKLLRSLQVAEGAADVTGAADPADTLPFLAEELRDFVAGRKPERVFQKSLATATGPVRFLVKLQRLLDASQKIRGTSVTLKDLGQERQATQSWQESAERFRLLFDNSNDAIFVHPVVSEDEPGTFVEVNARACESLGYTREEFLALAPRDLSIPEMQDKFTAIRQELLAEKYVLFETVHVAKDGKRLPVEINARLFACQGQPMVLSIARDITRRKLAEMEVQRLASFPQLSPCPTVEVDAYGQVSYANPAALNAGLKRPEELLPPDLEELFRVARETKANHFYREVKVGDVLYGEEISFPEKLPVARIYATNITAHRQLEEQLELKGRLLDCATDLIYLAEMDGALVYCNESVCQQLQYSREELLQQKIPHLLTPEFSALFPERVNRLRRHGQASFETAYCRKDGTVMPVEVRAQLLPMHDQTFILSVSRDISERKAAELALLNAAHKWRTTFDAIGDGVFLLDREGRVLQANRALATLVQRPFSDIIGRHCYEVLHNTEAPVEDCPLMRMWETRKQEVLILPAGERWLKASVYPIIDAQGEVTGAVHTISDITDSVRANGDLRSSLAKLQRTLNSTVFALASTLESRDPYTSGHQRRVAHLAAAMAQEMGCDSHQIEGMRVIGFLHDIGKIAVPAEILSRPGKINLMEFNLIKTHPQVGHDILKTIEFPWPVAQAVLQHHERLDGSGYPDGLKDTEIIQEARILAVADVVEAMSSHRPYRPSLGLELALEEISSNQDHLYDRVAVEACVKLFQEDRFTFE